MKLIRLFSLLIVSITLLMAVPFITKAQENANQQLANVLTEFENDEIDANNLNIDEPTVLPGQFSYNWQILKENMGLFFTWNSERKMAKMEEISNRRLVEAQKLSETGTTNAADKIAEALKRYENVRQKISDRLESDPELKNKLLEKMDANQLKHQEILSTVVEKLRDKASTDQLEKIEQIQERNALRWYDAEREKIQERLENAIRNNDVGSKFKQLKNIAVLQELSETLPEEARDKVEAARIRAEERLAEKLANATDEDREKFGKYIINIKMSEIIKQKLLNDIKENQKLPDTVREKAENLFANYSEVLRAKFENLDEKQQQEFLNQFKERLSSHPVYMEILQNLKNTENREQIQDILETQADDIKARIQQVSDPATLRNMEQNLEQYPALKRQIQEQQRKLNTQADL